MKIEKENIQWWNDSKNKEFFNLPISIIKNDEWYIAAINDDTKSILGDNINACAQGKTKEEAVQKMFQIIRLSLNYNVECKLNYQRFVPFRKGNWKYNGGKWFIIFGINFYFRYGNNMKGGKYIPFTKLNISISNLWKTYKNYKINK